ncbi:MAG: hypothetical protein ACOYEV_07645 [Candidatus Nanopelagicales bacterium]
MNRADERVTGTRDWQLMAGIASAQFAALTVFSAAVTVGAVAGRSWQFAIVLEVLLYALALVALGIIARGLWHGQAVVRTGFLLFQVFGLPAAWQLWGSDLAGFRIAGAALAFTCLLGAWLALRSAALEGRATRST